MPPRSGEHGPRAGPCMAMPQAMVSVAAVEGDAAEFTILRRSDEYRLTLILAPAFQMYNQPCRAVAARPAEVDIWLSLRSQFPSPRSRHSPRPPLLVAAMAMDMGMVHVAVAAGRRVMRLLWRMATPHLWRMGTPHR